MKVGDLYYALGIKRDGRSFAAARQDIRRFDADAKRRFAGIGATLGKALRPTGFGKDIRAGLQGVGAGLAAGFAVAVKDAVAFDEQLTRLDISSRGAMGSMAQVRAQILGVSQATGLAKEELLDGAASFVAITGDGAAASQSLGTFARVQKATAAGMGDIAGAAAAISQQLGVQGGEFEDAFSILVAGGKAGKIELKDLASTLPSLAANFKQFAGSQGLGGVAELGSAFQIVARNFGSANEAATGLESLMGSLVQHAGKLKSAGVDVFEADGKTLKSLESIVAMITKRGFTPTRIQELLGRKEAVLALGALRDYNDEWRGIARSTRDAKDIAVDYDRFNRSSAAQMQKSWNGLKISIAQALSPERVEGLVAALGGLLTVLGKAAGLVDDIGSGLGTGAAMIADKLGLVETESPAMAAERRRQNPEYQERKKKFGGLLQSRSRESLEKLAAYAGSSGEMGQMALEARGELSRRDLDNRRTMPTEGLGDSTRMMDAPTMMEQDAARGAFAPQTTINITAPAGADAQQYARVAREEVNRALETKSRELTSQLGQ